MRKDSLSITLLHFFVYLLTVLSFFFNSGRCELSESRCNFTLGSYLRVADFSAISRHKISLIPYLFHLSCKLTLFLIQGNAELLIPGIQVVASYSSSEIKTLKMCDFCSNITRDLVEGHRIG